MLGIGITVAPQRGRVGAFFLRAWDYAERDLLHGDFRSRSTFLVRATTWPVRRVVRALVGRRSSADLDRSGAWRDWAKPTLRAQIAVETGGGLGDILSTMLFVETLFRVARRPDIDVFYAHKSHLDFACARNPCVRGYFPTSSIDELRRRYDAIIHVHRLVRYDLISYLRLTQLCPELFWLRDQAHRNADEFGLHMREMPHLDGDLAKRAVLKGLNRNSLLGFSGGLPISGDDPIFLSPAPAALQIFQLTGLEPGRYITIHDGFDTFHRIRSRRSTKQWPASYWQDLIDGLRNRHPGTKIVQVGGGHSQPYRGIDTNLVGKATFDQVAWLLKYAVCHIDGESGLVRVAHEMAGRSVVMFGPTNAGFFAFPENVNLLPESCGNCFWSTPEWLAQCPRGLEEPECTSSITPRRALDAVDQVIRARADILPTFVQTSSLAREEVPTPADNEPVARAQQQVRLLASELAAWMPTATIRTALVAPASSGVPLRLALAQLGRVEGVWFHVAEAGANRHAWRQALQNSGTRAEGPKGFTERLADPLNIPSGDHAFDLLVLSTTSSTRYELEFSMREMLRILRPGGLLFYAPPHVHEPNGKDHGARGLSREDISGLLKDLNIAGDPETVGKSFLPGPTSRAVLHFARSDGGGAVRSFEG